MQLDLHYYNLVYIYFGVENVLFSPFSFLFCIQATKHFWMATFIYLNIKLF